MTKAKEVTSVSISATAASMKDELAFQRLEQYCKRMGLGLMVQQDNDRVNLHIAGQHQNMVELITYLEDKSGEDA